MTNLALSVEAEFSIRIAMKLARQVRTAGFDLPERRLISQCRSHGQATGSAARPSVVTVRNFENEKSTPARLVGCHSACT